MIEYILYEASTYLEAYNMCMNDIEQRI
jgi:hypothetical protein